MFWVKRFMISAAALRTLFVASGSPIKQFSAKHTDQKFYVNDVNVSFRAKGENEPIRRITEVNQWDYNFEKQNYLAELIPSVERDLMGLIPRTLVRYNK